MSKFKQEHLSNIGKEVAKPAGSAFADENVGYSLTWQSQRH